MNAPRTAPAAIWITIVVLLAPVAVPASLVLAHETDQFSMPAYDGRAFADLGPEFDRMTYDAIVAGVAHANAVIRACQDGTYWAQEQAKVRRGPRARRGAAQYVRPEADLAHAQSPLGVAQAVHAQFPSAFELIEGWNARFLSDAEQEKHPGTIVAYKPPRGGIYEHVHLPVDPRQVWRLWHAGTTKVHGIYLGGDKIGHFLDMGFIYYRTYQQALDQGKSEKKALDHALKLATDGPLSENGILGYWSATSYSNADLAANYVGMRFYENLTQPVVIRGVLRTAMLRRAGDYWAVNDQVKPDTDYFADFFTDHFNEALNPSKYEPLARTAVRDKVKDASANLLRWYADPAGRPRPRQWFLDKLHELKTYYGQDYRHKGDDDDLVSIANTCF